MLQRKGHQCNLAEVKQFFSLNDIHIYVLFTLSTAAANALQKKLLRVCHRIFLGMDTAVKTGNVMHENDSNSFRIMQMHKSTKA
jgi:hypothetical protein